MIIIYAHPNKDGHCGKILSEFEKRFNKKNIEYQIIDLYKIKFDPNLHPNEHYSSNRKNITAENKIIQDSIKSDDKFIFIYPTWWNNVPAILKGFIDRIFVPGFAFIYDKGIPKGLLSGKAIVFTTTGSPKIFYSLIAKKKSLKIMSDDTLRFCGIKTKEFYIGNAKKIDNKKINEIKKEVNKAIEWIIK